MVCPYCRAATRVANSRPQKRSNNIWRRRICLSCRSLVTTIEKLDLSGSISVVRSDKESNYEPLHRDKLFVSILNCLKHRKNFVEEASALADEVILKIVMLQEGAQVGNRLISKQTYQTLKAFDDLAGAIYLGFHPNAKD